MARTESFHCSSPRPRARYYTHFTDVETEAQRVTQRKSVGEPGFEPRPPDTCALVSFPGGRALILLRVPAAVHATEESVTQLWGDSGRLQAVAPIPFLLLETSQAKGIGPSSSQRREQRATVGSGERFLPPQAPVDVALDVLADAVAAIL